MNDDRQPLASALRPSGSFPDLTLAPVSVSRGHSLPRWEANGAVYAIALHLADSVPADQLQLWREQRAQIQQALKDPGLGASVREALVAEMRCVYDERVEKYLVAGSGSCRLRDPAAASAVIDVLQHGNGSRYALHAYAVMPNHLHVIAGGFASAGELKAVIDQWKAVSAHAVNRLCGRKGEFWQRDAYTRIIRSREEYAHQLKYVRDNPTVAGLTSGFVCKQFV